MLTANPLAVMGICCLFIRAVVSNTQTWANAGGSEVAFGDPPASVLKSFENQIQLAKYVNIFSSVRIHTLCLVINLWKPILNK